MPIEGTLKKCGVATTRSVCFEGKHKNLQTAILRVLPLFWTHTHIKGSFVSLSVFAPSAAVFSLAARSAVSCETSCVLTPGGFGRETARNIYRGPGGQDSLRLPKNLVPLMPREPFMESPREGGGQRGRKAPKGFLGTLCSTAPVVPTALRDSIKQGRIPFEHWVGFLLAASKRGFPDNKTG